MKNIILKTDVFKADKINKSATFRVKYFRYGFKEGREINIDFGKYTLRIAQYQFALWNDCKPVFNLLF